jgi:heme-degrading monooxygenase HmoA
MYAVMFEVWPQDNRRDDYLELAARLRTELEKIDGFVSVERFESLSQPGKLLSLSIWRDETAIRNWHEHALHREAQGRRADYFADYRIRVASVIRDYGMSD